MICNVALIPGDAAYVEYMTNITMGRPPHDDDDVDAIAFPKYERPRTHQDHASHPLEIMLDDIYNAMRSKASQVDERGPWGQGKISLPLAFSDPGYADRFENEMLYYFLARRMPWDEYDLGSDAAFAAKGGVCLAPPVNPLLLATTPAQQPLIRFAASARLAMASFITMASYPLRYNARFACDPLLVHPWPWYEKSSDERLTIDGY